MVGILHKTMEITLSRLKFVSKTSPRVLCMYTLKIFFICNYISFLPARVAATY